MRMGIRKREGRNTDSVFICEGEFSDQSAGEAEIDKQGCHVRGGEG
jgi:hypothetical protein